MDKGHGITVYDRAGNRLRGWLQDNGHIHLAQHAHRYTYGRLNRKGDVELYDDEGGVTLACVGGAATADSGAQRVLRRAVVA